MTDALVYHRFPMWLSHKKLDPVIVNDSDQEQEYLSKGYFAPVSPDPEGYLLFKVAGKLYDAIATMNQRTEKGLKDSLASFHFKLIELIRDEIKTALNIKAGYGDNTAAWNFEEIENNINTKSKEFEEEFITDIKESFADRAMEAIRAMSKGH